MKNTKPPALAALLQPFVDRRLLAGAVLLVADRRGVLDLEAVGYADVASRKPMRPNSLFWIASQTKSFTATALMMLVDEGKVNVGDRVEKYLPEFKGQRVAVPHGKHGILLKKPKHPITLRHILSHTSGLPFKSALEEPARDLIPLSTTVRSYAMTPLGFEPGTRYLYSNAGFNTAGRIIEVVSGMPYEAFVQTRLLAPLGMTETSFRPAVRQLKRLARPYKPNEKGDGLDESSFPQYTQPYNDPRRQAVPGGGLFSTANDVSLFCRMLLNGGRLNGRRYVSEDAIRMMTRKQTARTIPTTYGLGWRLDGAIFGHSGALQTNMTIDPVRGLVLVFLVQHTGFATSGGQCLAAFTAAARERYGP